MSSWPRLSLVHVTSHSLSQMFIYSYLHIYFIKHFYNMEGESVNVYDLASNPKRKLRVPGFQVAHHVRHASFPYHGI